MDKFRSIEVFIAVVGSGSFTAAADELGMSRPMVSKYIRSLEDGMGVRLLNRTTRTVAPTEAGQAFHQRCQVIMEHVDLAFDEASHAQLVPSGRLQIGASIQFGTDYVTPALAAFQDTYSAIDIELILNDRQVDVVADGYDLVIRIGHLQASGLIAVKLAECPLYICASRSYFEKHGRPEAPEDLIGHNCLLYTEYAKGARWELGPQDARRFVSLRSDFQSNNGAALVRAAVAGRGIVLEPGFSVRPHLNSGELEQVLPDASPPAMDIFAVYPDKRLMPQRTRALVEHLRHYFSTIVF